MRLTRQVRAAVLSTALVVLAVPGPRAQADDPAQSELTLERVTPAAYAAVFHDAIHPVPDPLPSVPGVDEIEYQARLTSGGVPLAGATVVLQRLLATGDTWRTVGTATTDGDGTVTFSTPVKGSADYQAVFSGGDVYAASDSEPQGLSALRDFNTRIAQPSPGKVYLEGNINPGWNHRRVSWQKRTCATCRWRTIDSARTGKTGSWRFQGGFPPAGRTWWFRAWLSSSRDFAASTSSVMRTTAG